MKKIIAITSCMFFINISIAQNVGIGTTNPNASAALEISSTNKGLLIPRMATTDRNTIATPPKGLMVYDTTFSTFFYYDGMIWRPLYEKNYDSAIVDYSSNIYGGTGINLRTGLSIVDVLSDVYSGSIFDNGGPTGNYSNNNNSGVDIYHSDDDVGIKIKVQNMDAETFHDSLFILNIHVDRPVDTIAKLTGTQTGTYIISPEYKIRIVFKSDNAGNFGGFRIRWGRIKSSNNLQIPAPLYGWYFDNKKIAAMGGLQRDNNWHTDSIGFASFSYGTGNKNSGMLSTAMGYRTTASGVASTAMGYSTTASGDYSIAMGYSTTASGNYSIAMGNNTIAEYHSTAIGESTTASGGYATAIGYVTTGSGYISTAMGIYTTASGNYSTAMGINTSASGDSSIAMGAGTTASGSTSTALGYSTKASGKNSTAMGNATTALGENSTAMGLNTQAVGVTTTAIGTNTIASGDNSTAMGNYVSTANRQGAFIIGDMSSTTITSSTASNSFSARFSAGYRLFTNSTANVGAILSGGANSWSTISDVRRKENFIPVDGEDFLQKISAMPLTTWNYIGQNSKTFRHYGPMAQDFYAAFGKDKLGTIGCDTLINQQDFLGVNLIAIQALEKRTKDLQEENIGLKEGVIQLQKENIIFKSLLLQLREEIDELKTKK